MKFLSIAILVVSLASGQSLPAIPVKIELSDTILRGLIVKCQPSVSDKEIMIVARESKSDSVRYYITSINSKYKIYKNMPCAYTQVNDKYIFLYTGLEQMILVSDADKHHFINQFSSSLRDDILADGKTRNPESFSTYDPIQYLAVVKDGKKVYEDFKKGFGPMGIPYLNNK